jgi:hypothetical protein
MFMVHYNRLVCDEIWGPEDGPMSPKHVAQYVTTCSKLSAWIYNVDTLLCGEGHSIILYIRNMTLQYNLTENTFRHVLQHIKHRKQHTREDNNHNQKKMGKFYVRRQINKIYNKTLQIFQHKHLVPYKKNHRKFPYSI